MRESEEELWTQKLRAVREWAHLINVGFLVEKREDIFLNIY